MDEGHWVFDRDPNIHKISGKEEKLYERLKQREGVISELIRELISAKKHWGVLKKGWVEPDRRAEIVAFVSKWSQASSLGILLLLTWIGLSSSKFYQWKGRQGQPSRHNAKIALAKGNPSHH